MPTKNTVKIYVENGYYHIYNRGVDKRNIFIDEQDCKLFLHYLKLYLSPPEVLLNDNPQPPNILYKILNLNLSKEIDLLSFALMPNHFHLQIKQYTRNGIEKLTRRVITSYAQYFNKKYDRIGTLFESTYKAVFIENDRCNLYLSSYIHRNPMKLKNYNLNYLEFSSYPYYLKQKSTDWVKPEEILSFFNTSGLKEFHSLSYESFVEDFREDPQSVLAGLTIEKDFL